MTPTMRGLLSLALAACAASPPPADSAPVPRAHATEESAPEPIAESPPLADAPPRCCCETEGHLRWESPCAASCVDAARCGLERANVSSMVLAESIISTCEVAAGDPPSGRCGEEPLECWRAMDADLIEGAPIETIYLCRGGGIGASCDTREQGLVVVVQNEAGIWLAIGEGGEDMSCGAEPSVRRRVLSLSGGGEDGTYTVRYRWSESARSFEPVGGIAFDRDDS
jgi:hypothetical protein